MASDGFPATIVVVFTAVYSLIFLSSVVGNSFVLSLCYRKLKRQACSPKLFIVNLAVADLTFIVLTILDLIDFVWSWVGGQVTCKLEGFLIEVCYTASVMTLVLISYERRKAVVEPFSARILVPEGAHRKLIAVWVISLIIGFPLLFVYGIEQDYTDAISCDNMALGNLGRQIYYGFQTVFLFLLPLTYMVYAQIIIFRTLRSNVFPRQNASTTVCSNRGMHRKVAKTLAALTFAFVICWSPFIVVRTLKYFDHLPGKGYVWRASQALLLLNTAVDPILYGIYGENLRPFLGRFFKCANFGSSTRVENIAMRRRIELSQQ